jgi:hypothetical protein
MNKKDEITNLIYNNLPAFSEFKKIPKEKIYIIWWVTGRSKSNLRLTELGNRAFEEVNVEYYEYPLFTEEELKEYKRNLTFSQFQLYFMLQKIECPFYIDLKKKPFASQYIRLYDSKVAMMIGLYGSFLEYVKSLKKI